MKGASYLCDLCREATRGLNSAGVVTFWPEHFMQRRKESKGEFESLCVFLFGAHRRSHRGDDGVGDSAFEELVELSG